MTAFSTSRFLRAALLAVGLAVAALSFAAAEPTITQIYDTAKAGKVEQAQGMIDQVLAAHPKSAKAHFVQAELFAVQGRLADGKKSLDQAETLAPGLPFAKPEAVSALRERLKQGGSRSPAKTGTGSLSADAGIGGLGAATGTQPAVQSPAATSNVERAPASRGFSMPWGTLLMIGAGLAAVFLIFRRKPAQTFATPSPAGGGYAMGQQPGGMYPGGAAPAAGGSNIMGGLATGLAVGAGVIAAQQIGQRVFGHNDDHRGSHDSSSGSSGNSSGYVPMDANSNMGGTDFGISDSSSWDSGGSSDSGGSDGGGWD